MRILTYLFLGLLVLLMPFLIRSNYWMYMFTLVGIYIILVASLDLIYGLHRSGIFGPWGLLRYGGLCLRHFSGQIGSFLFAGPGFGNPVYLFFFGGYGLAHAADQGALILPWERWPLGSW